MTKNPLIVSFQDLVDQAQAQLRFMEHAFPARVAEGSMSGWTATHKIAVQKQLVKLLRKAKKEPQLDLFNEFEKQK